MAADWAILVALFIMMAVATLRAAEDSATAIWAAARWRSAAVLALCASSSAEAMSPNVSIASAASCPR